MIGIPGFRLALSIQAVGACKGLVSNYSVSRQGQAAYKVSCRSRLARFQLFARSQVCLEYVANPAGTSYTQLFAAQTLRYKVQRQLDTLPSGALPQLRDKLAELCNALSGAAQPIFNQLCLALAALAVQWQAWTDVQSFFGALCCMLKWLSRPPWSSNAEIAYLTCGSCAATKLTPRAALTSFTVLPEECCEDRYSSPLLKAGRHSGTGQTKVRCFANRLMICRSPRPLG